jgi:hypothetical protein
MIKPYSSILIALLKGIVYEKDKNWNELLQYKSDVKRYFTDVHLDVIIDESEGYAYLKQRDFDEFEEEQPKLIEKRPLSFHVSLLCLLLRKELIENDKSGDAIKAVLSKESILQQMMPYFPETTNEEKPIKKIESAINALIKEGFLRKMKNDEELYEINRIIKAFVNADIVVDSLEKLKSYTSQNTEL